MLREQPYKRLVLAIDFDGTIAHQAWPNIGSPIPGAIQTIQRLHKRGHKIIIWTCRTGKQLEDAIQWLIHHKVPYDAINANLPERIKAYKGDTRKVSADLYIDDRNIFMRDIKPQDLWDQVRREVNKLSIK